MSQPVEKEKSESAKRPGGLIRILYRLPVWLYRLGFGWLIGERFLLIHHVGRNSGRHYQSVVEVVRRDPAAGIYVVTAAYGPQSDWYRNLQHTPEVTIDVGRRRLDVHAEFLSEAESGREMADYARRHPTAARNLTKMLGYEEATTGAGYRQLGQAYFPFVVFHTQHETSISS